MTTPCTRLRPKTSSFVTAFIWSFDITATASGRGGVVLADGIEPGPVYVDAGSGSNVQTRTDWWLYDGAAWSRAPRADAVRAACACGWRGTRTYPLVWIACGNPQEHGERADAEPERPTADVDACLDDWKAHIADVDAATVPVPDEVASLLADLRARLTTLADESPLAALRVLGQVERKQPARQLLPRTNVRVSA
ncbi:hypothetical protein [Streptodolium elevatio]